MQIVDAQSRLWRKGSPNPPNRAKPYLMDGALRDMDAAGAAAVLHPPS
jgi:hypothetical protein